MQALDRQLSVYSEELKSKVRIDPKFINTVCSQLKIEIEANKINLQLELERATPIPIKTRLEELHCFQVMMDTFIQMKPRPEIVRTQVMTQNYVCFVYLKDTLLEVLRKNSDPGTVTKRCSKYLLDNPIRAFRNAIAHGNWMYLDDYSGLQFWAHQDGKPDEPMKRYEVSDHELKFWQMLSRATAYTAYLTLDEK